jgi:hypothetical protein
MQSQATHVTHQPLHVGLAVHLWVSNDLAAVERAARTWGGIHPADTSTRAKLSAGLLRNAYQHNTRQLGRQPSLSNTAAALLHSSLVYAVEPSLVLHDHALADQIQQRGAHSHLTVVL